MYRINLFSCPSVFCHFILYFILFYFLDKLYAQHGARTLNPKFKRGMLHPRSQLGTPVFHHLSLQVSVTEPKSVGKISSWSRVPLVQQKPTLLVLPHSASAATKTGPLPRP